MDRAKKLISITIIVVISTGTSLVLLSSSFFTKSVFAIKLDDPNYKWLLDAFKQNDPLGYGKDMAVLVAGCVKEAKEGSGIIKMDSEGLKEVITSHTEGWQRGKTCNEIADQIISFNEGDVIFEKKDYKRGL